MRPGLGSWVLQRVSAIYMLIFVIVLVGYVLVAGAPSYRDWHQFMAYPASAVAWALFVFALLSHTWVGIRDVVMDYVHAMAVRALVLALVALALLAMAVWTVRILLLIE